MVPSACERRCQNSCIWTFFPEGRLATEHSWSDSRLPTRFFTYCVVMEGAEGTPGNLLRLPLQTALTVCGEKSDAIHSHYSTPMQVGWYNSLLRGQAKLHLKIHGLPHIHSGENAHDLEFGIIIPTSKPISSEVVYVLEKKTTYY